MKNTLQLKTLVTSVSLLVLTSQALAQSVSYNITDNDPDKRTVFIHLNPFNVQAYLQDITIGYNLQGTWLAAKHLQVEIDYRKAYLDGNATGIFSPKGLKKSSQLQIGGVFNLMNKLKEVNNKVVLRSTSDGKYRYTTSIQVRANARKIAGLRGGLQSFYSNHKVNNDVTEKFDGSSMQGKASDGVVRYLRDSINFETINFTVRSTGLYAGLDYKCIRNVILQADGYGRRSNKVENNFYADVMFTPLVKYDLKPNAGQATFNNVDVNISQNKKRMLGWRVGWQYTFNHTVGFNTKMEVGQQPGVANKSFFMALGFGMTLGFKVKQLPI